jgi:hypothetical protein
MRLRTSAEEKTLLEVKVQAQMMMRVLTMKMHSTQYWRKLSKIKLTMMKIGMMRMDLMMGTIRIKIISLITTRCRTITSNIILGMHK